MACDVELGPRTIVVGPNGAGKSNFLDVLRFVADALHRSVDHAVRERGGFVEVCHRVPRPPRQFGIHLEFRLMELTAGMRSPSADEPTGAT